MIFEITVNGLPVAKGRPRVMKSGHTYTPQKTKDYEEKIQWEWNSKYGNLKPSDKPIQGIIVFYMPMPKSWSKKKREQLKGEPHTQSPDLDNLLKAILDALNGLAYYDDSQVFKINQQKLWSEEAAAVVWLEEGD